MHAYPIITAKVPHAAPGGGAGSLSEPSQTYCRDECPGNLFSVQHSFSAYAELHQCSNAHGCSRVRRFINQSEYSTTGTIGNADQRQSGRTLATLYVIGRGVVNQHHK